MDFSTSIGQGLIGQAQDAYGAGLAKRATTAAAPVNGKAKLNQKQASAAAEQFEAFFIGEMMNYMTEGIKSDDMFGGGHGEDMWKTMLNQEYGKQVAKSGGLGIANQVMKGMLAAQESRTASETADGAVAPAAFMPLRRN